MVGQGLVYATHTGLVHHRVDGTHVGGSKPPLSLPDAPSRRRLPGPDLQGRERGGGGTPGEAVKAHISGTTGIGPSVELVFGAGHATLVIRRKGAVAVLAGTANPEKAVSSYHSGIPTAPK